VIRSLSGLVSSFNHPRGNITGIAFMSTRLGPKNLELLHELLPKAPIVCTQRTLMAQAK